MNIKWIAFALLTLIATNCSKEKQIEPKNWRTIKYNQSSPLFQFSLPLKQTNKKSPLVIFVGAGLFFPNERMINGSQHNFYKMFDFYFNNNKVAVGRFTNLKKPLNFKKATAELKIFFQTVFLQKKFSRIYVVTFGEGSFLLPQLIKNKQVKAGILVSPVLGSVETSYRWKIIEEPFIHFRTCFDYDGDYAVSLAEFKKDIYHDRENEYTNRTFKEFNFDTNKIVNQADFESGGKLKFAGFIKRQTAQMNPEKMNWLQSIRTNQLDLKMIKKPLVIFHGQSDRKRSWRITKKNCPKNIQLKIIPGTDSEMNWKDATLYRKISQGMMDIIRTIFELEKKFK